MTARLTAVAAFALILVSVPLTAEPYHRGGKKKAAPIECEPEAATYQRFIDWGAKGKGDNMLLRLTDSGRAVGGFFTAMAATNGGYRPAPPSSGFSVNVYTPLTWVAQQASDAAKEYRPFTMSDITEEMREQVLRVVVFPDTPAEVSGRGMAQSDSVQHVVIREEKRKLVVQPLTKDAFNNHVSNAMGGQADFEGVTVLFPLAGVTALRGADGNESFIITVIGSDHNEKNFTVKDKHFERLP